MGIEYYRNKLEQRKGKAAQIEEQISDAELKISNLEQDLLDSEEAQAIIQMVAKQTQDELTYHISELGTLGMRAVFDDPYELLVDFVLRRNKTEADIWFVRDGEKIDPLSSSGGGAVDIASLTLQVALHKLQVNKSRALLILDEPLKWLKGEDLPVRGALMLQELSRKLNLQVIMVSHSPELIEGADRIFKVTMRKGTSYVEQVR